MSPTHPQSSSTTGSASSTRRPLAVVTGASRGIGAAVARALAPDHDLVLLGRDGDALDSLSAELASSPRTIAVDLTDHDAVAHALADLERVDALVHCAGVAALGRIDSADPEQWRRAFEVNVLAVVVLTRTLLPALRRAGGQVVAINSGAGLTAKPDWGSYSASKFALRAVTDSLRAEEPDLRVTSVHPGRVDTDMQRAIVSAEGAEYRPERYLSAESVAAAVRTALGSSPDAHLTEIVLRPR